jgi:hypothetical protein
VKKAPIVSNITQKGALGKEILPEENTGQN